MGQTLSEPVTTKESSEGQDTRVIYGASSMQGWRICTYTICHYHCYYMTNA